MARVDHLRHAYTGINSQFHFHAESQLSANHSLSQFSWGGEIVSVPVGVTNPGACLGR